MLLLFLLFSALFLAAAYRFVGARLARELGLSTEPTTPAHRQRDGKDFEPAGVSLLLPQHFSAIAAAGPIVGPILAGLYFGWLPAWLWILLGSVFIGGIHDFMTLVASVRHGAQSIAEVVRRLMSPFSHRLFLGFIWISLVYVIVAFTDITAGTFAGSGGSGPAVASSSILYLVLAVLLGLVLRFTRLGESRAKLIFLPLVLGVVWLGQLFPLDLAWAAEWIRPNLLWGLLLLGYCFVAALSPVWLLLQPRGALGGYFLYALMVGAVVGVVVGSLRGGFAIEAPAFGAGSLFTAEGALPPLFPVLFITVACGACSGFHSIVASGTTSKQLSRESDARPVAYGGMLLEAFFACISLASLMIVAKSPGGPDAIFAGGIAQFVHEASFRLIPVEVAASFALLCFATFIFDTLDSCTRLARYVLLELVGWTGAWSRSVATLATIALPAALLCLPPAAIGGRELPLWRVFWNLFGTSNQLLAALALLAVTLWLRSLGKRLWITLLPCGFMLMMTLWSVVNLLLAHRARLASGTAELLHQVEAVVALLLALLAAALVREAWSLLRKTQGRSAEG